MQTEATPRVETYNPLTGQEVIDIATSLTRRAFEANKDLKQTLSYHGIVARIRGDFFLLVDLTEPPKNIDDKIKAVKGLAPSAETKMKAAASDIVALVNLRAEIDKAIEGLITRVTIDETVSAEIPANVRDEFSLPHPEADYVKRGLPKGAVNI